MQEEYFNTEKSNMLEQPEYENLQYSDEQNDEEEKEVTVKQLSSRGTQSEQRTTIKSKVKPNTKKEVNSVKKTTKLKKNILTKDTASGMDDIYDQDNFISNSNTRLW